MAEPAPVPTDDDLATLREAADLRGLVDALLHRGEDALTRGAWADAQRDLDEAAEMAALAGQTTAAAHARRRAAVAYRADGQPHAAAKRLRSSAST